jgi:hypothetical protein
MDWQSWLSDSFDLDDLIFGLHPLDGSRATIMVKEARGTGWTDAQILAKVDDWLRNRGATSDHRIGQRVRVQDFLDELT